MAKNVVKATIAYLILSMSANTAWAVTANPDKFGGTEDGAPVTGNILFTDVSDSDWFAPRGSGRSSGGFLSMPPRR